MNFIDTLDNSPTDLIGSKYGVVVFAAKDFDDWCESLAIAHDDEVYIASNAYLEDIPDERLTKNGLVRLPVSEDGDVLHIGELVDEKLPFGGYAAPAPIDTMELSRGASGYVWMAKLDAKNRALVSPKLLRHHHKPTVEDVLREVVTLCHNTWKKESAFHFYDVDDVMESGNIAEYAAKLRLAGDAE